MYGQLEAILGKDFPNSQLFWKALKDEGKTVHLRKNEFLIKQGEICKHGYFLNKGCIIQLFDSKNGKEIVLGFYIDHVYPFLSIPDSYFNETGSTFQIKAIEDCELIAFSKDCLEHWASTFPAFSHFYHRITATALHKMHWNSAMRLSLSAENFLQYLMKNQPELTRRIPDKYIARFIGVSDEWLCKIKKRILTQTE